MNLASKLQMIALLASISVLSACTANKLLPKGEYFYDGAEITYDNSTVETVPRSIRDEAYNKLKPDPTPSVLWMRPKAWFYLSTKEPDKKKGFKHFLKYRIGKKPTYFSQVDLDKNLRLIESTLDVNGFFRNKVAYELDSSAHALSVLYSVMPGPAYQFDSLNICVDPLGPCQIIRAEHLKEPIIESGELFQKERLETARNNFANGFRDLGYYYFAPQFILFEADSSNLNHRVKLNLNLKENIPSATLDRFTLASATIDISGGLNPDTLYSDSIKVIINPEKLYLKPSKLKPYFELQPGMIYSRQDEVRTLRQLNKLDVFDFVSIRYEADTSAGKRELKAFLLANPLPKQSLSAEFNLSTTSTNFTGPGLQLEYFNRNIFRGAEKFRFTTVGRYEVQLTGPRKGLASYEFDTQANLLIPRVSGPLRKDYTKGNVPSTKYRLAYRLFNQPDYYAQSSFGASFGYEWLSGDYLYNDLRLISFDYVRLLQSSGRLDELIDANILTRESFDDQVLAGIAYSLSYAPAAKRGSFFRWAAGGTVESMGNVLFGVNELFNAEKNDAGQYTFFGVPLAQYLRFQTDFRAYFKWNRKNEIATRQILGIGLPYLNSSALPFSKQFFVGGASSLRGFPPQSVGPGTYLNQSQDGNSFFDQTGDIQIEYNIENRTRVSNILEIAIFFDAGNVWLKNESETRPGGKFEFVDFVDEMAFNTGIGFRFDFDFVLIRFDWGFPLRVPYRPAGDRWILNSYSIDPVWWTNNTVLNFAIGYPF